jgi:predicted ThiF/HesA family dinucleotide-utilizing enzyme
MNSTPSLLRRCLIPFALAAAVLAGAGCTQVLVSPDTRGEYKLGELQVFADRDFATAYNAAKEGLKEHGLFLVKDDRLVVEAELNGRDATDTLVVVKIKEVGPKRTSVKIRYGIKGDLAAAQALYAKIEKRY